MAFAVGVCRGCWAGCCGVRFEEGNGGDEQSGAEEAGGVQDVTTDGTEGGDHEGGGGGSDDAHAEHGLLHEGVGRAESVEGNGGADGDTLGGAEEAGDDADGGEDEVEVPGTGGEDEQEDEAGAEGVAGDHGGLEGPSVYEDPGHDSEQGDGEHVGDLDAGDLLSSGVELEGEDSDDGEEGKEVAKDGDDLGEPEAAHHGDAQDGAHGEGLGQFGVENRGRIGCGCAHGLR